MEKDLNLKNKSAKGNAAVLPLVCHKFRECESLLVVSKHDREIEESTRPHQPSDSVCFNNSRITFYSIKLVSSDH